MAKKPKPPSHAVPVHPIVFATFLRSTLIPDLKDSGNKYTAGDFEIAAGMAETLALIVDILWPGGDPDREWTTDTIENVARACDAYRPKGGR